MGAEQYLDPRRCLLGLLLPLPEVLGPPRSPNGMSSPSSNSKRGPALSGPIPSEQPFQLFPEGVGGLFQTRSIPRGARRTADGVEASRRIGNRRCNGGGSPLARGAAGLLPSKGSAPSSRAGERRVGRRKGGDGRIGCGALERRRGRAACEECARRPTWAELVGSSRMLLLTLSSFWYFASHPAYFCSLPICFFLRCQHIYLTSCDPLLFPACSFWDFALLSLSVRFTSPSVSLSLSFQAGPAHSLDFISKIAASDLKFR